MLISEISVYEFLKEKIKLTDADAKKYARELAFAEDNLHSEIKDTIAKEIKNGVFATKKDIKDLEVKIEKGFREVIVWVITFITAIIGIAVAIIKLF
ncbi:MAG: hypothetical protein ACR2FN_12500 [Chitinophagaceae bacterium]